MDSFTFFILAVFWGAIWGGLCAIIADRKGRDLLIWFTLGFFFSFIALAFVLALDSRKADAAAILPAPSFPSLSDPPQAAPAPSLAPRPVEKLGSLPYRADADERRECPYCAELIRVNARVCRFCGNDASRPTEA